MCGTKEGNWEDLTLVFVCMFFHMLWMHACKKNAFFHKLDWPNFDVVSFNGV